MKLLWLPEAVVDLERIAAFLLERSPSAAGSALAVIEEGADRLSLHPEIGRPMADETGRRELFVPFGAGAYVLRYRIQAGTLVVIRLWHCRETRS